jgi:hypothetical protein
VQGRYRAGHPRPLPAWARITGTGAGPVYQLADYLDQHGRRHRAGLFPPAGFWTAAANCAPGEQATLSNASRARSLYRPAAQLLKNAAAHSDPWVAASLVDLMHEVSPDDHRAAQFTVAAVSLDDPAAVAMLLASLRAAGAEQQVTTLSSQLLAAGMFGLFRRNAEVGFRFGAEPDGSPAVSWGWEDLD